MSKQQLAANIKKRHQAILDAATTFFSTEGYEGTTIKKIAAQAEVSFGSVFSYFTDKEELFYTMWEQL